MAKGINLKIDRPLSSTSQIDRDWFGAVQTGFNRFDGFDRQVDFLGAAGVRWPGGTLSETKTGVYSLTNPDIFDGRKLYDDFDPNRERPGLSDMLRYCRDENVSFTMIVPTARYADDTARGVAELRGFLGDLFAGKFGALPRDFTLEIGNEYAFLDAFEGRPGRYGEIADAFVRTIAQVQGDAALNPAGADVNIGVQIGYSHSDDAAIRGAFSGRALAEIDALIFHSHPISLANLHRASAGPDAPDLGLSRIERYGGYIDAWQAAIRANGGREADIAMTEWSVGNSALSAGNIDLDYQDYGLRGVSTLLDQIAAYSAIGVDSAAIWGVDVENLSYFSKEVNGRIVASHTGVAFRMFAEHLDGLTLLGDYAAPSRDQDYMTYSFGSASQVVIYVIANDIDDGGQNVELAIDGFSGFVVEDVTTIRSRNAGESGQSRLDEVPVVGDQSYGLMSGGLRIRFQQDYQLVQIELSIRDGANPYATGAPAGGTGGTGGRDVMTGSRADDVLHGRGGNDQISGWRGNDLLTGGSGADSIFGNEGQDTLRGGDGNDRLLGGDGRDVLDGGAGNDVIDGGAGDDVILGGRMADNLIGGSGNDHFRLASDDTFARFTLAQNATSASAAGTGEIVDLGGYTRYHTVIDGRAGFDTVTFGGGDDAILLHDTASDFHASLKLRPNSQGAESMARISGVEELRLGGGDDILDLTSTDYDLSGRSMKILAGSGNDIVWGSAANEAVFGGAGDDTIAGGAGRDRLHGGDGADTFQFTATSRTAAIRDFDPTEGDRIEVFGTGGADLSRVSATFRSGEMRVSFHDGGTGRDEAFGIDIALDGDARDLSARQIADYVDFM